jgi:hypothetical protein
MSALLSIREQSFDIFLIVYCEAENIFLTPYVRFGLKL